MYWERARERRARGAREVWVFSANRINEGGGQFRLVGVKENRDVAFERFSLTRPLTLTHTHTHTHTHTWPPHLKVSVVDEEEAGLEKDQHGSENDAPLPVYSGRTKQ